MNSCLADKRACQLCCGVLLCLLCSTLGEKVPWRQGICCNTSTGCGEHLGGVRQELLQAAHRGRQLRQRLRLQAQTLCFTAVGLYS